MAKQIGDKHRLIRGVAGSGKTLILASRAKMLAKKHPDWNILILCFNISLSRNIIQMVRSMYAEPEKVCDTYSEDHDALQAEVPDNLHVRNFHQWFKQDLQINNVDDYIENIEIAEKYCQSMMQY